MKANYKTAKSQINASFDALIDQINNRRQKLLKQVDIVTNNKLQTVLHNKETLDQDSNIYYDNDTAAITQINMDLNFNHLCKILSSIGKIDDFEERQYVKNIVHGSEGDTLLLSGFIRNINKNMPSMIVNKDVEGV